MLPGTTRVLFRALKRRDRASPPRDGRHIPLAQLLAPGTPEPVPVDPLRDIAVLQYTGGTTGVPKGAMLSHANLYANAVQGTRWFGDTRPGEERTLAALPFFHVFAMTTVLLFSVHAGAEIIMLPRFELAQAVRTITRRKPTFMPGVPTMFNAIAGFKGKADLTSIRFCISGGAPLPPEVKARFEARTGCVVVEGYGLTETSPCVVCNPPGGLNKTGSIGLPMTQTEVELRDPADPGPHGAAGRAGRTLHPGAAGDAGLLEPPGRHRRLHDAGRVFPHRRHRGDGRSGLFLHRGPDQGPDPGGRLQRLSAGGGGCGLPASGRSSECTVIGVPDEYRGETVKAFIVLKRRRRR